MSKRRLTRRYTILELKKLLAEYQNIWWSPQPGYTYVKRSGRLLVGPGLMARNNPGVFNLYWLMTGLPDPKDPNAYFLAHCTLHKQLLYALGAVGHVKAEGIPLSEWAITHKPKEFTRWLSDNQHKLKAFPTQGTIPNAQYFCNELQKAVATLA